MKKVIIAATLLSATLLVAQEQEIVFRNATVLTVTRGTINNGSVLIRGGKIAAVGSNDEVKASSRARVIDATGKFLFPGIIDTHSHSAVEGSVNEGSLPNTGMVRVKDALTGNDVDVYRQLAGGTTAANILHGSANTIGGQNAVAKWKWGRPVDEWVIADAPAGIKFALGENPKSANWPPGSASALQYPATRMGVEEVLRDAFTSAREYMQSWDDYEAARKRGDEVIAPRRDLLMEEMADILRGKVFVHSHCYRADEIMMLMNVAKEFGFKIRTFQHVLEGYKVAPEMAANGAGAATFIDWWGFKAEAYEGIPYNVALLSSAGVLTTVNSDSSELARRLNLDAAKAMKYGGMSEEEAMKLCTINAAKQLGIDHRVGSIEVGKDADVVLWTAHPLSTYARPEMTLIEGVVYFDRATDLANREKLKAEKTELLAREKKMKDDDKKAKEKAGEKKPAAAPAGVSR
jgi:imidazolonepropionase-like amidohydrolase